MHDLPEPDPAVAPIAQTPAELAQPPLVEPTVEPQGEALVESPVEPLLESAVAEGVSEGVADVAAEVAAEVASDAASDAASEGPPEPAAQANAEPAARELSPAACAARLAELFPGLFAGPPKPIKLRIQADIQARAPGVFSKRVMSLFLHRHTTTTAYLKAMVNTAQRFDLDGVPVGEVAAEHLEAAKVEIERRRSIVKERIKGQRDAEMQARREAEHAAFKAQRKEQQKLEREAWKAKRAADEARRQQDLARFQDDQARRDRAMLLRTFESSTLTKSNFCVLKRIVEADLDAQLKLAREEREAWFRANPAPPRQAPSRPR